MQQCLHLVEPPSLMFCRDQNLHLRRGRGLTGQKHNPHPLIRNLPLPAQLHNHPGPREPKRNIHREYLVNVHVSIKHQLGKLIHPDLLTKPRSVLPRFLFDPEQHPHRCQDMAIGWEQCDYR